AGFVARIDEIGGSRTPRRRWSVAIDGNGHADKATRHHIGQLRPRTAVNRSGREMEQEIDESWRVIPPKQPAKKSFNLRPNARERGDQGEQGVEDRRPHRFHRHRTRRSSRAAPFNAITPDIGAYKRYMNGARLVRAFGVEAIG